MIKIDASTSDILKLTPIGGSDNAFGNTFSGINHRQSKPALPIDKSNYGLVFFTRPQLNMQLQNLRHDRYFTSLTTEEPASIQRIIRTTLDPRLQRNDISCPFVDPNLPFIAFLSNLATQVTGWPDINIDTYKTEAGMAKESFAMVDSVYNYYGVYELNATFKNVAGNPVLSLFNAWQRYMTNVSNGIMVPYIDYMVDYEIDYMTRIWRLDLDMNRTYVDHISCTGAAFPTGLPTGKMFDWQSDQPFNLSNQEISIPFTCLGACYDDPILIKEFNDCVKIFNPNMRDDFRDTVMKKLPMAALSLFNHKGYPRINTSTYELEWYVAKDFYERMVASFGDVQTKLSIPY
jgi:hypothetical protein